MKLHEEALEYQQKSLGLREKIYGKEHSVTAIGYHNVGMSLRALGRNKEALENLQKAFQIRCNNAGESRLCEYYLKDLIRCLNDQSDWQQCERVKQEGLLVCVEKIGKDDPLTQLFREACPK